MPDIPPATFRPTEPNPSLAYVICTSPRSGSTLLCDGLSRTGKAGDPAEYFDDRGEVALHWRSRFAIPDAAPYADGIVEATKTANGNFGTKLHWTSRQALFRAFRNSIVEAAAQPQRLSLDELLCKRFSKVRYIWLRRRNKVAQGVSHFRATRSGIWELPLGERERRDFADDRVAFDFRLIDHCVNWATRYDDEWELYFDRHQLKPMPVFYEDLVERYDVSLRAILEFLGVEHSDLPKCTPHLQQLADHRSGEWEGRYRALDPRRTAMSSCGAVTRSTMTVER